VFLPDVDERSERLVGFVVVFGEVDAVEVLEHPPGRFQLGPAGQDPSEGFDPVVGEVVEAGELEVPGPEDVGFEGGSGPLGADALDTAADLDHPGGEPAGDVEPVEDVGGVTEMLGIADRYDPDPSETTTLTPFEPAVALRPGTRTGRLALR
jgi:hypothetical protein